MNSGNATSYVTEVDQQASQYEQLLADIWVGVLLSLILLSCVCCMCTCLIYHKFQKWKRLVLQDGETPEILSRDVDGYNYDCESLPSYTIASGLPSYEEALKQLEIVKSQKGSEKATPPFLASPSRVSLMSCIHNIANEKS